MEVTCSERHGGWVAYFIESERSAARQTHLDDTSGPQMFSRQTCGQGRCVVGDHEVAATEKIYQSRSRPVMESVFIDGQQFRLPRTLDG
jgi:hypothetical protein